MRKIAINTSHAGFHISPRAISEYCAIKGNIPYFYRWDYSNECFEFLGDIARDVTENHYCVFLHNDDEFIKRVTRVYHMGCHDYDDAEAYAKDLEIYNTCVINGAWYFDKKRDDDSLIQAIEKNWRS